MQRPGDKSKLGQFKEGKWARTAVVQGVVGNEAGEAGRGPPCCMEAKRRA